MFTVSQKKKKKSVTLEAEKNVLLLFKRSFQHASRRVYLCLLFRFFPSSLKHVDKRSETNKQLFSKIFTHSLIPHGLKEIFIFP